MEAAIAPSFLTNRVVPPAPGNKPTRISGNPIFAFELFAENILWVDKGISKPIPKAVPGSTETIGFPPFFVLISMPASSIFLKTECIFIRPLKTPSAGFSPTLSLSWARTFRSIPAAKSFLLLVNMQALILSSSITWLIRLSKVSSASKVKTFIDLFLQSQVIVAIDWSSTTIEKSEFI